MKKLQIFITSTRAGIIRGRRLFLDKHFRQEGFRNISFDIYLNSVAGGFIFYLGDVLAQLGEARQSAAWGNCRSIQKERDHQEAFDEVHASHKTPFTGQWLGELFMHWYPESMVVLCSNQWQSFFSASSISCVGRRPY